LEKEVSIQDQFFLKKGTEGINLSIREKRKKPEGWRETGGEKTYVHVQKGREIIL